MRCLPLCVWFALVATPLQALCSEDRNAPSVRERDPSTGKELDASPVEIVSDPMATTMGHTNQTNIDATSNNPKDNGSRQNAYVPPTAGGQNQTATEQNMQDVLFGAICISNGFLIVTFVVYAFLSELRNLHGRCLMCYMLSLIMGFCTKVMMRLALRSENETSKKLCVASGFLIQFFFLATLFWLNVMCFDIWWTFRGIINRVRNSRKETKRFLLYSLYAWTCPSVLVGVTIQLDNISVEWLKPLKPGFGVEKCWFETWSVSLLFFHGPMGLVLTSNIVMFVKTACVLYQFQTTRNRKSRIQNVPLTTERFSLYLKLFIVMGVNWIMEFVSWIFQETSKDQGFTKYIWYVFDMGNALQGLPIFLIFICKRRIISLLVRKVYPACPWEWIQQQRNVFRMNVPEKYPQKSTKYDQKANKVNQNDNKFDQHNPKAKCSVWSSSTSDTKSSHLARMQLTGSSYT